MYRFLSPLLMVALSCVTALAMLSSCGQIAVWSCEPKDPDYKEARRNVRGQIVYVQDGSLVTYSGGVGGSCISKNCYVKTEEGHVLMYWSISGHFLGHFPYARGQKGVAEIGCTTGAIYDFTPDEYAHWLPLYEEFQRACENARKEGKETRGWYPGWRPGDSVESFSSLLRQLVG